MSDAFKERLSRILPEIVDGFGTPFHIYDETGICDTCDLLNTAFSPLEGFREYFAVKALPNPAVMTLLRQKGFGFDCSSVPELVLARKVGSAGEDIMFTSNNTRTDQFQAAMDQGGAILNLDDLSLIRKLPQVPDQICFRYNPGSERSGNHIIGNPVEAKYGLTRKQLHTAYPNFAGNCRSALNSSTSAGDWASPILQMTGPLTFPPWPGTSPGLWKRSDRSTAGPQDSLWRAGGISPDPTDAWSPLSSTTSISTEIMWAWTRPCPH
jgi:hypothetical protein